MLYGSFGQGLCVTDGEWTLFKSPVSDGPLHSYSAGIFRSLNLEGRFPPDGYAAGNQPPASKLRAAGS